MTKASPQAAVIDVLRTLKRAAVRRARTTTERGITRGVFERLLTFDPRSAREHRERPHFLIARYGYHGKDPRLGESTEAHFLDNSLTVTGQATFDTFFWEADYTGFPRGDWALLEKVRQVRPDAILLSSYEAGHHTMPRVETIRMLRKTWGIPIIGFWYDTCWDGFWASIEPLLDYLDLHVVADNPAMTFVTASNRAFCAERFLWLALPWDARIYHNPSRQRDVDVSFLGQVGGYRSPRLPLIEHLMEHNVPIYWSGFDKAQQRPLSKYVEVLTRSKIALNFSHSVNHHQLKGRVFEIMLCGAMMLETSNPQTSCRFTPMQDYVSFDSPDDLLEKIRYYLTHDEERTAIAARGQAKAERECDNAAFWNLVIGRLEARTGKPLRDTAAPPLATPATSYNVPG